MNELDFLYPKIHCRFSYVSVSGSVSERFGSEDPHPDPYQKVTDPEHWFHSLFYYEYWEPRIRVVFYPHFSVQ